MNATLRTHEHLALHVLDSAPVLILVLELDGRIQHLNEKLERLSGFSLNDVRGKSWFDTFLPERDRERIKAVFAQSIDGAHVHRYVNPIVTVTGEERQIEWTSGFLRDNLGTVIGVVVIGQDVTEQLAVQDSLRTLERRLQNAYQVAELGAWERDLRRQTTWWSDHQYRLLGVPPDAPVSYELFESLVHPDDRTTVRDGLTAALADGVGNFYFRIERSDGQVRHMHGRATVTFDERGVPLRIMGTNQDISARTLADDSLRRSERRFKNVIDNLTDGFFTLDRGLRLTDVNVSGARIVGKTTPELIGRNALDVLPRVAGVDWERALRHSLETGEAARLDVYVATDEQWYDVGISPFEDGIALFLRDVTGTQRAKLALEAEGGRLREAQRITSLGSWELDLRTNFLLWSDEIYRIFEIDSAKFGASYDAFLALIHPEDKRAVDDAYQRAVTTRTPYEITHRLLMPDGRVKWVRENGLTKYDDGGRPLRSFGTVQDISRQIEADQRLRNIFDSMFAYVGLFDLDGNTLEINRAPLDSVGVKREDVIGAPFWDGPWWAYSADVRETVRATLARAARGELVRSELSVQADGERMITMDTVFSPLRDSSGRIVSVVGSGVDITEQKNAADAARRSSELLRAVMAGAPVVIFAMDTESVFTLSEGLALAKLGLQPGQMVGASALEAFGYVVGFRDAFQRALAGEQVALTSSAGPTAFEAVYAPTYDASGTVDGVIGVAFDVSARVAAEAAIREREARLAVIFNTASDALLLLTVMADGSLQVSAANRTFVNALRPLKCPSETALIGLTFETLASEFLERSPEDAALFRRSLDEVIATRAVVTFEYRGTYSAAEVIAEVTCSPVFDDTGTCTQVLLKANNVTAKRLADARIAATLREKETLLREIHHRVKNNLQVVSGLLHFQSKKFTNPADLEAMAELRQRIISMTLLHERLYRSQDLAEVAFSDYVRDLVAEVMRAAAPRRGITFDIIATSDVRLPIELAMPGGMIVNELVTNVLKYAFPERDAGTATVSVRQMADVIEFSVDDDGVGFPDGFNPNTGGSFGWELIRALVAQLDGTVETWTDRGAHVRVSFAVPAPSTGRTA